MDTERHLKIPLDARIGVGALWLVSLGLLTADSLNGDIGILGAWAFFTMLAGGFWAVALLHSHSRRVILEVMSWEHRQQSLVTETPIRATERVLRSQPPIE